MKTSAQTLVLGGGLAGLTAAYYLGGDCPVLEAESVPGGLCRSFSQDGFVFDLGGHILFSRDQSILREMTGWLGENVGRKRRNNQIRYRDRFVKYPFENGLAALDREDIYECLISFLNRPDLTPENLQEWCYARFGSGIAEKYLLPYNRKIWKRDLKQMSLLWVDRIPDPSQEEIVKSALGIETEGYRHQLNFYYPKRGGIEALLRSLTAFVSDLRTGFRVKKIVKKPGGWEISDGRQTVFGKTLISTIPVFDLVRALDNVPVSVVNAVGNLEYNSLIVVMLGVDNDSLRGKTAIYIPDPEVLAHRVCFLKEFSDFNAPGRRSHLIAEITVPPGDPLLGWTDDRLVNRVVSDLQDICGISKKDVTASVVKRIACAYVVYDLDYEKNRAIVFDYLDQQGIHYAGRFGSFRYLNMDAVIRMSKDLIGRIDE